MFCHNCGNKVSDRTEFCISCGKAVAHTTSKTATPNKMVTLVPSQGDTGLVGFSDRCYSPEIMVAAKKNKKSSIGCIWLLVFVPLIVFPIAGLLMDDFSFGESAIIGVGIAIVMLIMNVLSVRRAKQPVWEGIVTNKSSKVKYEHKDDATKTYTEYTVAIITDKGKKRLLWEKTVGDICTTIWI